MEPIKVGQKKTKSHVPVIGKETSLDVEDRDCYIALPAYYKAEARGYEPSYEIQDWLDAEAEIKAEINIGKDK
jgi:Protein of unknown function (DUF2934)